MGHHTKAMTDMQQVAMGKAPPPPPGAPGALTMASLDTATEFTVKQTKKGCFQECFGCEANSEFHFYIGENHVSTIEEQSSCCMRFCCKNSRPWTTKMSTTTNIADAALLMFERPFRCNVGACKCCCYQEVMVTDPAGAVLGGVREQYWYCVPYYEIYDKSNAVEYLLHQPTCVGGMCVNCCAQGCCNCRVPFMIHDKEDKEIPSTGSTKVPGETSEPMAQICKVWSGFMKEAFTDADTFELKAPDGASSEAKARLIGATLMINQIYFEGGDNKDNN